MYIDTSSLFKKYFQEDGSDAIIDLFKRSTKIFISSITYIEMMNSVYRYYKEKLISKKELDMITESVNKDFSCFSEIPINKDLKFKALDIIKKNTLKSLDLIHLISAQVSHCQKFVTSDKKLYKIAKSYLSCEVCFI